ncbi:Uu.00g001340.m01.CDS01 [Anthostomella pinea]|uniref:Uu.00g001340.m01.CDS01 n=1 Tax=Anthostomella pinea TaxID=933095 RepID=A0AAI8VJB8_9PEZI|nr:Uu.00g001340.m01.CDS01 [Anthostomella pinea]
MEDNKAELLQYARDYAPTKDLYAMLGVTSDTETPAIHRAWRKASLKHHPDKAGAQFDAELWQLFERARDILSQPEARQAYDTARGAALQHEQARAAMDKARRDMIEDLEARERGVKRKADGGGDGGRHVMTEAERRVLLEKGNRRLEERRRLMAEAEARDQERERLRRAKEKEEAEEEAARDVPAARSDDATMDAGSAPAARQEDGYDDRIADLERRLQESREKKAARKSGKKVRKGDAVPSVRATMSATSPKSTSTAGTTDTTQPSRVKGDLMARLRAAQAEKERKKAEEAAGAAAQ